MTSAKILPCLWLAKDAEAAAKFYARLFPDSGIDRVYKMAGGSPNDPPDSIVCVDFTLMGTKLQCFSANQIDQFTHAMSLVVICETQDEIDRYYNGLMEGGTAEPCGWVKDRHGVSWQIVPRVLSGMMAHPDREKALRAQQAMMKMQKLDIAKLQQAFDGR